MKHWYVVQVYAGYEESVKSDLEKYVKDDGVQDSFGDVLIPSVKVKEFATGESPEKDQQLFPGYILVEIEEDPRMFRLVNSVPRVLKFLGGKSPVALSQKEIGRVIGQVKGEIEVATKKNEFIESKEIEIVAGPFNGFVGVIDKIDEENERLTVMVSIFGRMTPVEIGFDQVKQ